MRSVDAAHPALHAPGAQRRSAPRSAPASANVSGVGWRSAAAIWSTKNAIASVAGAMPMAVPSNRSRSRIWLAPATMLTTANGAIGTSRTTITAIRPRLARRLAEQVHARTGQPLEHLAPQRAAQPVADRGADQAAGHGTADTRPGTERHQRHQGQKGQRDRHGQGQGKTRRSPPADRRLRPTSRSAATIRSTSSQARSGVQVQAIARASTSTRPRPAAPGAGAMHAVDRPGSWSAAPPASARHCATRRPARRPGHRPGRHRRSSRAGRPHGVPAAAHP